MKQAYYYRTISPTQIAGLADAILEKVFGFEQVPDMVTLTANAQGHFHFKAQFMYEDSIPFPQKRSTASKEKEKQKVKDIALAFFRTANEKVKANKQPKLENQDSVRPMFQDRDVDRGAFPSDFPDLFPIQYLEWQSTEPIFHAEYPKNIHYYEVRFRVELPVIAKQRNIMETPKTETVQNPETLVARLSSNAPTNHAPQTQKLLDTFLGNATQTPTVKATVQNEYIVLHINPDDKRYEVMGVESCFVQIAGQEITDLLERGDFDLCFRQQGNLKVPYYIDGVAASRLVGEENSQKVINNDTNVIGVIRILLVVEKNTLSRYKKIARDKAEFTEYVWFKRKVIEILGINNISAKMIWVSKETVDEWTLNKQLKGNDYVVNIIDKSDLTYIDIDTGEKIWDTQMGVTLILQNNPGAKLTEYNPSSAHPECPIFIPYQYVTNYFKYAEPEVDDLGNPIPQVDDLGNPILDENGKAKIKYSRFPLYKLWDEATFYELLAYTCVHEIYHAMIYRGFKYAAYQEKGFPYYVFGFSYPTGIKKFVKGDFFEIGGHNRLDRDDMSKRSKQYSLNTSGEHTVHLAFLADLNKFDTATESSFRQQISIEELIDCFFVNPYIKMDEAFFNDKKVKEYININDLPPEIQGAIKARDDIFSWSDFMQGSAFGLMNRFRSDELHTRFVIPFLSLFQE